MFPRLRIAVYYDSCFWHGCEVHGTWPKSNAAWWQAKIEANRERDRATESELQGSGWVSLRVWQHEDIGAAVARVVEAVRIQRLHAPK